jgi:hypothetical protein
VQTKGLIEYTRTELERKSQDTLRRRVDVPRQVPIKIEFLVENTPNIELEILDDLRYRFRVEGGVYKEFMSKTLKVLVDYSIYSGQKPDYHRVLGEEFAHICLHQSLFLQVTSIEDFIELQNDSEWHRFEGDARRFSAAIRMPADLLVMEAEREYQRIVQEHGFGDPARIEKLLRNQLAQRFVVPSEEMHRRMRDWPCLVVPRLWTSIQAKTDRLVPLDWSVIAQPPGNQHQQALFGRADPDAP